MTSEWSEEKIAALVDGAIEDDREADALRQTIEDNADARTYAEKIERSNRLLQEAFAVSDEEPVPAPIEGAIFGEPGKVSVLRPEHLLNRWAPAAIAAGVALVIGFNAGTFFDRTSEQKLATLGDTPIDGPLHAALENLPSGTTSDDGVVPMLSFRDARGRSCREFEIPSASLTELEIGIACRGSTGRWHVEIVVATPATGEIVDGYTPASGPAADALDAMLDALGAGPPLSPQEEAAALRDGWRSAP